MADGGWFKENLGDVEGFEHPQAGKAYLFGESGPYERYRDLGIQAFEAWHCVRRLSPATLGVHLRDLFAMNRNKQRSEY